MEDRSPENIDTYSCQQDPQKTHLEEQLLKNEASKVSHCENVLSNIYLEDIESTAYAFNSENGTDMFIDTDIIDLDEDDNEKDLLDCDIYENERQGRRYSYPFVLAEDKWNTTDDDFAVASPVPIQVTHRPTLISDEPIFCDSSSSDSDDVLVIQDPIVTTINRTARFPTHGPSTPEIIKQFLPFEKFKEAYTTSHTNQIEIEEDVSVIPEISAPTTCCATKEALISNDSRDVAPSLVEKALQFEGADTSTSTSNTSFTETERADIVNEVPSAEYETTTDSASSSCGKPNSQTEFRAFLTASSSPSYSAASTSQFNASSAGGKNGERKRGRPAKDHADGPNPELMSRMNDEERKAYEDRIKNNEASRVSRRKKKRCEEEEKAIEEELVAENLRLCELVAKVASQERKLKKFLMKQRKSM
ncbi:uncharacterized protein [Drosophila takahashii]|uniref:uncharacterized protein isoform X1 n=1 Tax=Drosophila takahashii TaxID=29030 RepID=UPI0038991D5A